MLSPVHTKYAGSFLVGFEKSKGNCFVTEPLAKHAATDPRAEKFADAAEFYHLEPVPFPCQTLAGK